MHRIITLSLSCLMITGTTLAQDSSDFDFWLGKWDLTWDAGDGATGKGVNHIHKTLDGTVIQENFEATDAGSITGFKGMSISVFNPNNSSWHQAWADNQGGYFNFIGEIHSDRRIFKAEPRTVEDKVIVLRMVFYDIKEEGFTWDWERSEDGGETWNLRWRIQYKKATDNEP